jgi:hypothetical protein
MTETEKMTALTVDVDPSRAALIMPTARRAAVFVLSSLGAAIALMAVLVWTGS